MTGIFSGVITAMITPFKDGKVNFDTLGKLIDYQIEGGTDALVILGTTGEPSTMNEAEKEETIRYSLKRLREKSKL